MPRSRVYLPKLESPPATILEHLSSRFPHIPLSTWQERMTRGLVTTSSGAPLAADSPYRHGVMVYYQREVPFEPRPSEIETILYRDEEILAVDKPHGMPVTPAGDFVARCLLYRLQDQTGLTDLVPLHRLDRDTAGVVLFGARAESRARYHELFSNGSMEREYLAVADLMHPPEKTRWHIQNRLAPGEPWFRRRIEEGPVNAITTIELVGTTEGRGLFRLLPQTGRKHQLRVHMYSIGFPILGDPVYPEISSPSADTGPLQLLASRLTFADPVTGLSHDFRSKRKLRHAN